MNLPLAVAVSALVKDDKILLIRRKKGDYAGLLGLPGGKVEKGEHLREAAVREIMEEAGIKALFKRHLGFVSEHLIEGGGVVKHFLLHVCELDPETMNITNNSEGTLGWYELNTIDEIKDQLIPSDFFMIKKLVINKEKDYYDCVIEKKGVNYELKRFE